MIGLHYIVLIFLLFNSTAKYIAAPKLAARISITKNPKIGRHVFRILRPKGSGAGCMKANGSSVSLDPYSFLFARDCTSSLEDEVLMRLWLFSYWFGLLLCTLAKLSVVDRIRLFRTNALSQSVLVLDKTEAWLILRTSLRGVVDNNEVWLLLRPVSEVLLSRLLSLRSSERFSRLRCGLALVLPSSDKFSCRAWFGRLFARLLGVSTSETSLSEVVLYPDVSSICLRRRFFFTFLSSSEIEQLRSVWAVWIRGRIWLDESCFRSDNSPA